MVDVINNWRKYIMIYGFVLSFVVFYAIILTRYDSIKNTFVKMPRNSITLPSRLIDGWLLVTATLFPLNSVLKARRSNFDMRDSLSFFALIFGVLLGMIADVDVN